MKKIGILLAVLLTVVAVMGIATPAKAVEPSDKTLKVGLAMEPTAICELVAASSVNCPFTHLLYDTLVAFDSRDQTIRPRLADSWEIAEDSKSAVIHLNENATAVDGSPVTASDVVFSFKMAKEAPTTIATQYTYYDVDNFEIIDDHTLVIKTYEPYAGIVHSLGNKNFGVFSEHLMEEAGGPEVCAKNGACATGAYKFVEWVEGDHITLERRDDYFGEKGYYKYITFYFIGDGSARAMSLQSGDVDFIYGLGTALVNDVAGTPGLQVIECQSNAIMTMHLNTGEGNGDFTPNPALKDARVRKAIAYAIQKEALAMVAYDGHALPADSLAPRTSKYYEPMGDYYDIEAAKALLAEAGYADGFTLVVNALQSESKLCEVLQNQLSQIGITLQLNLGDIPTWQQSAMAGTYDIYLMSRFGSQVFMTASALDGRRGPLQENYSFVDDPSIYEAIDTVYGTTDIEKGKAAYTELMKWNLENFAVIPLVETATLFGAKDTIRNASLDYNGMQAMYGWLYEE